MSTVCAVSTPLAEGGISVIRISGEKALEVAERVFAPFSAFGSVREMKGYTCAYGRIIDPSTGETSDDALLTVFRSPKSYTGEDTAEISCHGGIYITKKVMRLCLENGCEPAERGEFTKRAFLNGKLSLTQAESVMDMISAQGEYTLRSARLTREGRLFRDISGVKDRLVKILGELAAWVDYPEEELPEIEENALRADLENSIGVLEKILRDYDCGMILRNGIDTVIAGKPNVGKSTLMNLLLGYDRSIVTDIAGTTRDVIEETARLGEFMLKLSDTAGIRETDDTVEKMGVGLARKRIDECALVIAVFDTSEPLDGEDIELLDYVHSRGKRLVAALNKSDLGTAADKSVFEKYTKYIFEISAKQGEGTEKIKKACEDIFSLGGYDPDSTFFANERQKNCAEKALKNLRLALDSLNIGETLDAVTVMIDYAAQSLMELTGEKVTEAVVDEVFSKFCVGK